MTERAILHQVLRALGSRPDLRVWRNNTGAARTATGYVRFGLPGSSDLLGILLGGRFLAIETKAPGGRLSGPQQAFREMVTSMGGCYVLARSVDEAVLGVEGCACAGQAVLP